MEPSLGIPIVILVSAGAAAVPVAWLLVRSGRLSIWAAMSSLFAILGVVSLGTERLRAGGDISAPAAAGLGLGAAIVFYAVTVAFVAGAASLPLVGRQTEQLYAARSVLPLSSAVGLTGLVAAGEELFWRGLTYGVAAHVAGDVGGGALVLAGYVLTNAASGSLPVTLAALVGGAVWGGLALGTGGVLASMVCHAAWSSLMVAFPPARPSAGS
ncbi:MAG: CPBP family intramembrane glutamic endopeptidase [Actinomycetota bacterium]